MIKGSRVLALITARGGSKGVPGKNIRQLNGKPLIAWTIEAAHKSRYIDRTVLSSEDAGIIAIAEALGCEVPFVRPSNLAVDKATSYDVAMHALNTIETVYDYLVLLQPTSPLRNVADIDGCIEMAVARDADCCVSVSRSARPVEWFWRIDLDSKLVPILGSDSERPTRRQDAPAAYEINGAVYVVRPEWLSAQYDFICSGAVAYEMPTERSIDIDVEFDFALAEAVMASISDA